MVLPSIRRLSLIVAVLVGGFFGGLQGCSTDTASLAPKAAPEEGTPAMRVLITGGDVFPIGAVEPKTIRVVNEGLATLEIEAVALVGNDVVEFQIQVDGCTGMALAQGGLCDVVVAYTGPDDEAKQASVRIDSNDPNQAAVQVALAGGPTPRVESDPAEVEMGLVPANAPQSATVTVVNSGNVAIEIGTLALAGDAEFSISDDACSGVTLTVEGEGEHSCEVEVAFVAEAGGVKTAALEVTSDLAAVLVVALSAGAEAASFAVSPSSLEIDFGPKAVGETADAQRFTVENLSDVALSFEDFELGGSHAEQFQITEETCSDGALLPESTCYVEVTFLPTEPNSLDPQEVVEFSSFFLLQVGDETLRLQLVGVGEGARIEIDPSGQYNFGQVTVGEQEETTVAVANRGNVDLEIEPQVEGTLSGDADFIITGDDCFGNVVAAGQSCEITVSFSPEAEGGRDATLTLESNDPLAETVELDLSGFGLASMRLNPLNHDFGAVVQGEVSDAQTFTVSNEGSSAVTIDLLSVSGGDFAKVGGTDTCSGAVLEAAGGDPGAVTECTADLVFSPTFTGPQTATLRLLANSGAISLSTAVTGTGLGRNAIIQVEGSGAFDQQPMGTPSVAKTFTVRNEGVATLYVGSISVSASDPFAIDSSAGGDNCSDAGLAAGASCTFGVIFAPVAFGAATGTLTIPSNDFEQPEVELELTGFGISSLALSPRTVGFGPVTVGTASAPQSVQVVNVGGVPASIGTVGLEDRQTKFLIESDECSGTEVPASGDCDVSLVFFPTERGAVSDILTVTMLSGSVVEGSLSGFGELNVVATPASLSAPAPTNIGSTSALPLLTVTNQGSGSVTLGAVELSSRDPDFVIQDDGCTGTSLAPAGGTCTVQVAFRPQALGPRTDTLTIETSATTEISIPLSGTSSGVSAVADVDTLDFTGTPTPLGATSAAQTLTIRNQGNESIVLGAAALAERTPEFVFVEDNCSGTELVPAPATPSECTILLAFRPLELGARSDVLSVPTSATSAIEVDLVGVGTRVPVSASPASVVFSQSVTVGASSSALDVPEQPVVTITYEGSSSTTLGEVSLATTRNPEFAIIADGCSGTLLTVAEPQCSIRLEFNPTTIGARSDTLLVETSTNTSLEVALSGTGVPSPISVDPTSYAFPGLTPIGGISSAKTFYLSNSSSSAVNIGAVELQSTRDPDFAILRDTCSGSALPPTAAPGDRCEIDVVFQPQEIGARTDTLVIATSAETSLEVSLSGDGGRVDVDASDSSLTFAATNLGSTSGSQILTLTNVGVSEATLGLAELGERTPSFVIVSDGCSGTTLTTTAPGNSCALEVAFRPLSLGALSDTLSIATSPSTQIDVLLAGTGSQLVTAVLEASDAFAGVRLGATSAAKDVTVTNTGSDPVTLGEVALSARTSDFVILSDACSGATLAQSDECTVQVAFRPLELGIRTDALIIPTSATASVSVALEGAGVQTPVAADLVSVVFDDTVIGNTRNYPDPIVVTNSGSDEVTLGDVTLTDRSSDFLVLSDGCSGAKLTASAPSCQIRVAFRPQELGDRSDTLQIPISATDTFEVVLSGAAVRVPVDGPESGLDFGNVGLGSSSLSGANAVELTYTASSGETTLGDVTLGVTRDADFIIENDSCSGATLSAASPTCEVYVVFRPQQLGVRNDTLSFATSEYSEIEVPLSGVGGVAVVTASQTSVAFATTTLGSTTDPTALTLTNSGSQAITLGEASLGERTPEFVITSDGCSGQTLAAAGTCTIAVAFRPLALGERSDTLTVVTTSVSELEIALSGAGASLAVSAAFNDALSQFPNTVVSSTSAARQVEVVNSGSGNVNLGSVSLDARTSSFVIVDDQCSGQTLGTVAPANTCTVDVAFRPLDVGALSDTLIIETSATSEVQVPLAGDGLLALVASAKTLVFEATSVGITRTGATPITVRNRGDVVATIGEVSLESGVHFAVAAEDCSGRDLAVDGTCSIELVFRPTSIGEKEDTLVVVPEVGPEIEIDLSGTGQEWVVASAQSLDFGNVPAGDVSSGQTLTLTNIGSESVPIDSVTLDDGAEFAIAADGCGGTALSPGLSCDVTVTYQPADFGISSDAVLVATGAGSDLTIELLGFGLLEVVATPDPLPSFGATAIGVTSPVQTVTVQNFGGAATITVVAPASGDFGVTRDACTGVTLATSASCEVDVVFQPQAPLGVEPDLREDSLAVLSTTTDTINVILQGQAVDGLVADSQSVTFADPVAVGSSSATVETIVLTNNGADTVVGQVAPAGTEFVVVRDTCSWQEVLASASCEIDVEFRPTAAGSRSDSLSIPSDASPTITVALSGVAEEAAAGGLNAGDDIGFGTLGVGLTSTVSAITVTNESDALTLVNGVSLPGGETEFTIVTDNCTGVVLGVAESCSVNVAFNPKSLGLQTTTVSISSAPAGDDEVVLSGTGVAALSVDPTDYDFGTVALPGGASTSQNFIVTNVSGGTLTLGLVAVSGAGDFVVDTAGAGGCSNGAVLTPGDNCSFSVTFEPSSSGAQVDTIVIPANGVDSSVGVRGTGVYPLQVLPAGHDFGAVGVPGPESRLFTVLNTSEADVTISGLTVLGDAVFTADDSVADGCTVGTVLTPGDSCDFGIDFAPAAAVTYSADVRVDLTSGVTVPVGTVEGEGL